MAKHNEEETNDIDFEATGEDNVDDPELEVAEAGAKDKLKDLRTKLKTCEAEKMEHLEQLQRAKAEFLNARKRMEDEKVEAKERAVDGLIEKLLPMHDSFSAAMGNEETWNAVDESWRKGVEAIHGQLNSLLQSYNVTAVNPFGDAFDPEHHEAMGYEPVTEEAKHDTVVKVLQAGFVRDTGDTARTIRPARVIVGNVTEATD